MTKEKKVVSLSKFAGAEFEIEPLSEELLRLWAIGVVAPDTLTDEQNEETSELAKKPINVADTTSLINFITQTAIANVSDTIHNALTRVEFLQYVIDEELDISEEQMDDYREEFKEKTKEQIAKLEEQLKKEQEDESEEEDNDE